MENTMIKEVSERIKRASKKIGKNETLPKKRLISDMLFGMIGSGETKLSSISRALKEKTSLQYTIKRLSRNLHDMEITPDVNRYMVKERLSSLEEDAIIAIDGGDIRKSYAESMEYLHDIYDASRKERAKGYQLFCMATVGNDTVRPLYGELYSVADPNYKSSYNIITKGLDLLVEENKGKRALTIVGDRGLDDEKLYRYYLKNDLRFITRLRRNRDFTLEGSTLTRSIGDLYGYVTAKKITGDVIHEGRVKESKLTIAILHGKINHVEEELSVIVVKSSLFPEPLYLLTNIPVETYKAAYKIYAKYLKRWGIELLYRVMKDKFQIEDIRVLKYQRMRNVFSLMMAALFLISKLVYTIGNNTQWIKKKILKEAKRLRTDGSFLYYSIMDGLLAMIAQAVTKPVFFETVYWQPKPYSLFDRNMRPKNG
jgi:hypothetical protein